MDALRRIGLIKRVEMKSIDVVVEQVTALFSCPVDANFCDRLFITIASGEGFKEWRGENRAACKLSHAMEPFETCYGHDASENWNRNSSKARPLLPIMKRVVVKEELRAYPICAAVDLCLEVIHLDKAVGRIGMTFRKSGNANAKGVGVAR